MQRFVKTYWWRHGETDWNAQRKWQGHSDIPLNANGILQAENLAVRLESIALEFIVSSDLSRAKHTADIVAKALDLQVATLPGLREGHFGQAEGFTIEEIRRKFGARLLEDWRSSSQESLDIRFAGGESKREIIERVTKCVEEIIDSTPFKAIGVSTHGGVLRKMLNLLAPDLRLPSPIPNCFCVEMQYDRHKREWSYISKYFS